MTCLSASSVSSASSVLSSRCSGLAEVDIKDHIKASFIYVWGFSILCMLAAVAFGIMPL